MQYKTNNVKNKYILQYTRKKWVGQKQIGVWVMFSLTLWF